MDPLSAQLSVLFFAFVFILVAVAAGAALLFMNPQRQATFITAVIGGLDLLLAAVFWLVIWFDSTTVPGIPPEVILGYAIWATVEGVVYVGLAIGIAKRDKLCALLSAVLSSLSTVVYLVAVDAPSKGGLVIRFVLLAMLWRAFMQLRNDLAHEEHLAQRRRDLDQLQLASRRGFEPPVESPSPSESPPPRSRRYEPGPFETPAASEPPPRSGRMAPFSTAPLPVQSTGRPSGQLIVKRGAPPPPSESSPEVPPAVPPAEQ